MRLPPASHQTQGNCSSLLGFGQAKGQIHKTGKVVDDPIIIKESATSSATSFTSNPKKVSGFSKALLHYHQKESESDNVSKEHLPIEEASLIWSENDSYLSSSCQDLARLAIDKSRKNQNQPKNQNWNCQHSFFKRCESQICRICGYEIIEIREEDQEQGREQVHVTI